MRRSANGIWTLIRLKILGRSIMTKQTKIQDEAIVDLNLHLNRESTFSFKNKLFILLLEFRKEKRVQPDDDDNDNYEESMSIEETNKLRAKLGMAPLEFDEGSKIRQGENGETIFTEDGVEIVHKAAKNWKDEKEGSLLKERLELQKQKRQIYSTVLKTNRTLAEPDFDDDVDRKTDSMRRERQLSIAARKVSFICSGVMWTQTHKLIFLGEGVRRNG